MTLKTTETTVGEKIDDGIITTKVKGALVAEYGVDSGDISVVTRDGEVQLSGFVKDQSQIDRATSVARSTEGVKNVINELSVKK
jgi:hyperosmotically inducible protein